VRGKVVHDKDGVAAAAVFAEMTRALARQGVTPYQHLNRLYQRYGCHITRAHYMVAPTPDVSRSIFTRCGSLKTLTRPLTSPLVHLDRR